MEEAQESEAIAMRMQAEILAERTEKLEELKRGESSEGTLPSEHLLSLTRVLLPVVLGGLLKVLTEK